MKSSSILEMNWTVLQYFFVRAPPEGIAATCLSASTRHCWTSRREEKSGDGGRAGEWEFDAWENANDLHRSPSLASVSPNVGAQWRSGSLWLDLWLSKLGTEDSIKF
jgi:hypothetical protein